ncbi:TetR/AcrR family transcriptional regulator [Cellulomonas soli]|uniref:TetR family transcriptional regulator n=1 Tax=Cellulomonas soli TaxID=931535 RepID=A0A512P9G1_9CELL|nr:TetR/AcrR family transcriptional regulator [Cellulomonas soli]NYI60331.1 AcrR family transcriptional regulator [Cellulomonas soli]GEP67843.1 TetR family transcriptional regulator [Cellulomonas soli]
MPSPAAQDAPPPQRTSPTGRPMRADARRNRERLLAAAREVFAEKPNDASMDDVARRAGVGIATLFRNFPKRIDLVGALYDEDLDALADRAAELAATRQPWEALTEWLDAFVTFTQAKRTIFAEVIQSFERDPESAQRTRDRIDAAVGTVLERAHAAGEVDPDLTVHDLIQLIGGLVLSVATDDSRTPYLLGLVLRGIRAPGR